MTNRYIQRYLNEMQALREEMDEMQKRMTSSEREQWSLILERNEFFDGEVEITHDAMVRFMERTYIDRGVA
jgi:hypothetical protein